VFVDLNGKVSENLGKLTEGDFCKTFEWECSVRAKKFKFKLSFRFFSNAKDAEREFLKNEIF
jgi:hypothetical protein